MLTHVTLKRVREIHQSVNEVYGRLKLYFVKCFISNKLGQRKSFHFRDRHFI